MDTLLGFLELFSVPLSIALIPALIGGAFWLGSSRPGRTIVVLALLALILVVVVVALIWIDVVTNTPSERGVGAQLALVYLVSDIGSFVEACALLAFGLSLYFSFQRRSWGWFLGLLAAFAYFVVFHQAPTQQLLFLIVEYVFHLPISVATDAFVVFSSPALALVTLIYGMRLATTTDSGASSISSGDLALQAAAQITGRDSAGAE